jgi:16S rRNA (cytidine1402-2'-O)-methyltransferase
MRNGKSVALVSDAGTPGIADPGYRLVSAAIAAGVTVVPIPGPSAVLAALAASAVAGPRWGFEGFLPRTGRERRERVSRIAADDRGVVLFEAPTRLAATLQDLAAACGGERSAAICRELTKVHEQIRRGTLAELVEAVASGEVPARGEIVIVIGPASVVELTRDEAREALSEGRAQVDGLVAGGLNRSEAARRVALATGRSRRSLYRGAEGHE